MLQGERRWGELSLIYVSLGVSRLVLGVGLLAWRPTEFMAMLSVTLGAVRSPPCSGSSSCAGHASTDRSATGTPDAPWSPSHCHNGFALLAFFALSNVDVIIARNVLPAEAAGLYAAGLILIKAVLFLPQFVVVIAFPTLSGSSGRRRALSLSLAVPSPCSACSARAVAYACPLAGALLRRRGRLRRDRATAVDVRAARHGPVRGAAVAVLRARPPGPQRHLDHLGCAGPAQRQCAAGGAVGRGDGGCWSPPSTACCCLVARCADRPAQPSRQ